MGGLILGGCRVVALGVGNCGGNRRWVIGGHALAHESVRPAGVSFTEPLTTVLGGSRGLALAWRTRPADGLSGAWDSKGCKHGCKQKAPCASERIFKPVFVHKKV